MKLSTAQKITKFFSSKEKFRAIEIESKQWEFTCSSCNEKSSVWEMGGIRYKAKGKPKIQVRCPKCGKTEMQSIHRNVSDL